MLSTIKSIRPFIGAKNYTISRQFYQTIGFEEVEISRDMSLFRKEDFGFYLQDAYVKKWINNTMIFLEMKDPELYLEHLNTLNITKTFKGTKLSKIVTNDWGKEFFLHDPSGVLWHIGTFF